MLITNSSAGCTSLLMNYCYGEKFHELFDAVVVQAIKPGFFTNQSPFIEYDTYHVSPDVSPKIVHDLQLHRNPLPVFARGNANHLVDSIERAYVASQKGNLAVESSDGGKLRFCFVGDHMIADVVTPKTALKWTTVAVVEELDHLYHSQTATEKGQHWGSFFYHDKNENEKFHTYFAKLLRESADFCCISVDDLVKVEDHHLDKKSLYPCIVVLPNKTGELM